MTRQVSLRLVAMVWSILVGIMMGSSAACAQAARDSQLLYELFNRLDQLEQEIRQLRGDLELFRYRQEETIQQQQELYGNLNRRLQALEQQVGIAGDEYQPLPEIEADAPTMTQPPAVVAPPPSQTPAPPAVIIPPSQPPVQPPTASGTEQAAYERAFNMLREGRYEQAISAFQEFLRDYPNSPLAGNAQYWLGETHYVTRDFAKAREAFLNFGSNYPEHDKMPEALLRLGYTYQELNEKAKAREVLRQLAESYPGSKAAQLAQQRLQSMR